jgi:hypothetical protein
MFDLTPMFVDGMAIRTEHNVDSARVPLSGGSNTLKYGEHAKGEFIYTVQQDGEATNARAGDQWLFINSPRSGWIAIKHMGVPLSTVTIDQDPDPTPDDEFISATLNRKDGSKVEFDLIKKTP